MKGIDVSRWQANIDWQKVKNAGIEFAIIKAGGSDDGFYTDAYFEQNYHNAKAVGMPLGAYYFVGPGCVSRADGVADAERFIEILKGKQFEFPVYMDVEAPDPINKEGITQAVIGFCETMENAGYYVGVYGSDISGFANRMDLSKVEKYTLWVARYGGDPQVATSWAIWQYASDGSVDGIQGRVDMNEGKVDFAPIIKSGGYNGFGGQPTPAPAPAPTPAPTPATIFNVGDVVTFNAIYVSSTSTEALTPAITSGTITKVIPGTHNPYLINDGTGWVNDACIITGEAPAPSLAVGANIRIKDGATDLNNGKTYGEWVYKSVYQIKEINGNRIVFGNENGITGATDVANIMLV